MKKRSFLVCIALMMLPSCGRNKRKPKKVVPASSIIDSYDIESVYKEQSLKEAALSAMRRSVEADAVQDSEHFTKKLEARLIDVLVPVNARPIERYFMQTDTGDVCVAYETTMQQKAVDYFYQREMERLGWQKVALLQGLEATLMYKKPGKMVVISLRPISKRSHGTMIVISQMVSME